MIFWVEEPQFTFNKLISKINTYTHVDGNWAQTEITTFYYSGEPSSGVKDLSNATFSFFPNPATESVFFKWNAGHEQLTVEIYQINGARIMQQPVYQGMAIPVSHLVKGVYLFKLVNEGQPVYSGKFVKK